MLRYIGFVRLEASAEARAEHQRAVVSGLALHPEFSVAYHTDAACLIYFDAVPDRNRVHTLGSAGVIIGTLFRVADEAAKPISALSPWEVDETVSSGGDALIRRHWGQYVALLKTIDGTWRLIRDPTGGFPCYYVQSHGTAVIFSHLNDCAPLLATRLTINYSHLHAFLHLHRFVPRDTGFSEIAAVHAGEAVDFRGSTVARSVLWEPTSFCRCPGDHENVEENIASMRRVVTQCVWSWAACRSSILHELSGGLDSSIVLACLAAAPSSPRVASCTHVTDSPEGDERYYARLMARHAHVPLTELPLRPKAWNRVEELVRVLDPVSPLFTAFQCSEDSEIRDLVAAGSYDCTFSGQGGDHLFLRTLPRITAADFAWVHGLSFRLCRVIAETAHASRRSIWNIGRQAIEHGYLRRPYDIWCGSRMASFIRAPPIDVSQSCHPWLDRAAELPPAKLLQVMCLTDTQTYWVTPRPYVDEIHPLISQPLLECCLQIPTYILSHGGTDRTIARSAFRDALPPEIARRSSKGSVDQFFFKAVYGNRERIRPFLLDGLLAGQGLLDRSELISVLDDPATIARGRYLVPIMTAVVCEMWLRNATSLVQSVGTLSAGERLISAATGPGRISDHGYTSPDACAASEHNVPPSPDRDPRTLAAKTSANRRCDAGSRPDAPAGT